MKLIKFGNTFFNPDLFAYIMPKSTGTVGGFWEDKIISTSHYIEIGLKSGHKIYETQNTPMDCETRINQILKDLTHIKK